MSKSQTKRAVQAWRWRDNARQKRRLNNVISEYVRHKHKNIYNDCYELYEALKKIYPDLGPKRDLTKTGMFKRLVRKNSDSSSDEEVFTIDNSEPSTSTVPPVNDNSEPSALTVPPAVDNSVSSTSTVPSVVGNSEPSTSTVPSAVVNSEPSISTVPPTGDNSPVISNEPVQAPLIPVQHLYVNYNSVGELAENLIQDWEYVNMNVLNNEILDDLINELEQDEHIQDLLNDINMQPFEQEEDIDEGIELNVENEAEELFDFDF